VRFEVITAMTLKNAGTLVRTDVSEECILSIIRVARICELGAALAVKAAEARCNELIAREQALVWDTTLRVKAVSDMGFGGNLKLPYCK
jgi:hypothetical protein